MGADPRTILPEGLVTIRHASWELYDLLLRDVGEQKISVTYDQGTMILVSPPNGYLGRIALLIGRLIEFASLERNIPIASFGSTTWKRRDLDKGLEAEESYYLNNEAAVRGRTDMDLTRDPPPDLAVDLDIYHMPVDRLEIYSALGFGEIWRFYADGMIEFLRLKSTGEYEKVERSTALPFITPKVVEKFVGLMLKDETGGMREFQKWLRTLDSRAEH